MPTYGCRPCPLVASALASSGDCSRGLAIPRAAVARSLRELCGSVRRPRGASTVEMRSKGHCRHLGLALAAALAVLLNRAAAYDLLLLQE